VFVRVIVKVTPDATAVAAADNTIVVGLVTDAIVAPPGIVPPVILAPTSAALNTAVADVTAVEIAVVPSVTDRKPG
jgi:hypothetical protein